jgi:formylglycine-generating enzyme required for sulfatase activity
MKCLFYIALTACIAALVGGCDKAQQKDLPKPAAIDNPQAQPKDWTNSIGMKFVWISPGSFIMGSPKNEEGRSDDEIQHAVTLSKGFFMGIHLVTQEQWKEIMNNNPSHFKGKKNLPVDTVSWEECQEFIKKLREKDNKPYRLPTEAEWEYGCRAGTRTAYNFGNNSDILNEYAWFAENNVPNTTHGVGQKTPNAWGLHDMHGNLWEWCQDWYGDYPQNEVVDPQGPNTGKFRILRGGSWGDGPAFCRSAFRARTEPSDRNNTCGFRLCFSN